MAAVFSTVTEAKWRIPLTLATLKSARSVARGKFFVTAEQQTSRERPE
jgi:hypothetical protein